jgi:FkbM family methyltransferase
MKDIFEYINEIIDSKNELVFFEFGMCDAYHSYKILDLLESKNKKFKYFAFEPVKSLFDMVNANKKNYSNGTFNIYNMAIGNVDGEVKFYESGGQKIVNNEVTEHYYGSSSINKPKDVLKFWDQMKFEEKTTTSIKFDTFIKQNLENEIIDFVWADIQGAELKLINGGKKAFKNVRYFYTEYSLGNLYQGEKGLQAILDKLPDFEIECDYQGDILLKNKNL